MTKNVLIVCVGVLALSLFPMPTVKAAETHNWVNVSPGPIDTDGLEFNWLDAYSVSYAYVEHSDGQWDEDMWDSEMDTWAEAEIGTAGAYAETGGDQGWAEVGVWPDMGTESYSTAQALQAWMFQVEGSGDVTFTLSYDIYHALRTDIPGDWADSWSEVVLGLVDEDLNFIDSNSVLVEDFASDGESIGNWDDEGDHQYGGYVSLSRFFADGDVAAVGFWITTETSAYTADEAFYEDARTPAVPVPAALCLGGLGGGIVAWLRKSRKL